MSSIMELVFYLMPEHPCSYLEDKTATTLVVDPRAKVGANTYSHLSRAGFRRSGNHYYKPNCEDCQACVPVRIPVKDYTYSRSERRLLKKHQATESLARQAEFRDEHYALYERYINYKHSDGDMYPPSEEQFRQFLVDSPRNTTFVEFWNAGCLAAVAVTDELDDGMSAIYTFYDPEFDYLSFGKYAVLWQIEQTRSIKKDFLYLGYWVKESPKMRYKSNFRPLEMLIKGKWVYVN